MGGKEYNYLDGGRILKPTMSYEGSGSRVIIEWERSRVVLLIVKRDLPISGSVKGDRDTFRTQVKEAEAYCTNQRFFWRRDESLASKNPSPAPVTNYKIKILKNFFTLMWLFTVFVLSLLQFSFTSYNGKSLEPR